MQNNNNKPTSPIITDPLLIAEQHLKQLAPALAANKARPILLIALNDKNQFVEIRNPNDQRLDMLIALHAAMSIEITEMAKERAGIPQIVKPV